MLMKIPRYRFHRRPTQFCAEAPDVLSWSAYSTSMHRADYWCTSALEGGVCFRHSTYKCRM